MWAHYGASHSGFVLAFDANIYIFMIKKDQKMNLDTYAMLCIVKQERARQWLSLVVSRCSWSKVVIGHTNENGAFSERSPKLMKFSPGEQFDTHLFRYPPETTGRCHWGMRFRPNSPLIISALQANSAFRHVQLKRAKPDNSHFLLCITDEII